MREVHTAGGSGEPIRLGQFLKLADAVESGSDVKLLLGAGSVLVTARWKLGVVGSCNPATWLPCAVSNCSFTESWLLPQDAG